MFLRVAATTLALVLPVAAPAQSLQSLMTVRYWYACSHPDFPASLGYSSIVVSQETRDTRGDGPGVTCSLLDIGYEASIGIACARSSLLRQSWGLLDYSLTSPLVDLPCGFSEG